MTLTDTEGTTYGPTPDQTVTGPEYLAPTVQPASVGQFDGTGANEAFSFGTALGNIIMLAVVVLFCANALLEDTTMHTS